MEEEKERLKELRFKADRHLHESGVFSYRMDFNAFSKQVRSTTSKRIDLVISSVRDTCDSDSVCALPSFCETVLKPGSYVFLIVSEDHFPTLRRFFQQRSFKVFEHSFKILYKSDTIQRRVLVEFPQHNGDIALIAKTPGQHPAAFHPKFCNQKEGCEMSTEVVRFASVVNVIPCQDKLKVPNENSALFKGEKSVDLLEHIILMLCPPTGSILDPIAGPLTTGIASLRTGRKAVLIEENSRFFNYGIGRLRIYGTPETSMKYHHDYCDPIDMDALEKNTEPEVLSNATDSDMAVSTNVDNELWKGKKDSLHRNPKRRKVLENQKSHMEPSNISKVDVDKNKGAEALMIIGSI